MKHTSYILLVVFLLFSCTQFIESYDNKHYIVENLKEENLSIIFSHNINGETHPCGCRHFPLGGLPQVAGKLTEVLESNPVVYVDTGDTLFPSSTIPDSLRLSLSFAAQNLARGLDKLGLTYFVPGDQDFAMGIEFLQKLSKEVRFNFLLSNAKKNIGIKHKKWAKLEKGPHKIYLLGLLSPHVLKKEFKNYFSPFNSVYPQLLKEIKENGYNPKSPFHRLIVLSHNGMGRDEKFVKSHPEIDWVIGAHSQSFTRYPRTSGPKTKLVQVLSRNHHIGEIKISLRHGSKNDKYTLHEVREHLDKKLNPNPFTLFIGEHKKKMAELQITEQARLMNDGSAHQTEKFQTAQSCIECHQPQVDKWSSTSHALAYTTLIRVKEENNLQCIKCHALGTNEPRGFNKAQHMIQFDEKKNEKAKLKNYWREVKRAIRPALKKSLRQISQEDLSKYSKKWVKIDETQEVAHNFANVQCLNCHQIATDHPFTIKSPQVGSDNSPYKSIKNRCISCHNSDQSPNWYKKDDRGLHTILNEKKLLEKIKSVACPKYQAN